VRLKRIGLTRFKAFQQAEIELAPLTVLIGHNNAGKSTVLHALTLLAQTLEQPQGEQLATSGPRVDLGNDPMDLTHGPRHEGWGIALLWDGEAESIPTQVQIDVRTHPPNQFGQIFDVVRTISLRLTEQLTVRVTIFWPQPNPNEAVLLEASGPGVSLSVKAQVGTYSPWTSYPAATYQGAATDIETAKTGDAAALQRVSVQLATPLLMNALPQALRTFRYVGADRHVKSSAVEVLQAQVRYPQTAEEIVNTLAYNRVVRERVSEACRRVFGFGIDTQLIAGTKLTLVAVDEGGRALNAVNLGAGFVQFAWILTHLDLAVADALAYPSNHPIPFVGLEEPELHLHPAQQPDIARILVNYVNANRQIITTTQSEHLLMAILQEVLEGNLKVEDLSVYYVENGTAQRLAVDAKGRLSGGLKGFFEANRKELTKRLEQLVPDGD
jgi:energy-coupling factor transporter ATP-binding protein EcfA2